MTELARIIPLFPIPLAGASDSGASARTVPCPDNNLESEASEDSIALLAKPKAKNANTTPDPPPRPRNVVWDACVEALGYEPKTDTEKSLWGKMVRSLKAAGADEEKIASVAKWYHKKWPDTDLTITAIEKWYSHFLAMAEGRTKRKVSATVGYCDYCGRRDGKHESDCMKGKYTT